MKWGYNPLIRSPLILTSNGTSKYFQLWKPFRPFVQIALAGGLVGSHLNVGKTGSRSTYNGVFKGKPGSPYKWPKINGFGVVSPQWNTSQHAAKYKTSSYLHIHLKDPTNRSIATWNPNGAPCFDWSLGLVLGGWPSKIEVIWVPGTSIIWANYELIPKPEWSGDLGVFPYNHHHLRWPTNRSQVVIICHVNHPMSVLNGFNHILLVNWTLWNGFW